MKSRDGATREVLFIFKYGRPSLPLRAFPQPVVSDRGGGDQGRGDLPSTCNLEDNRYRAKN